MMLDIELNFLKALERVRTPFLDAFFQAVTFLGEETLLVLIIAALYYIYDRKFARRMFYTVIMSLSINSVIKNIAARPRPFERGISCVRRETATGYSFPSGHTQNTATWTATLFCRLKKRTAVILSFVITLFVAFSRLYLGVHYPGDVIVGAALGFAFASAFGTLFDRAESENALYGMSFGALSVFAVVFMLIGDIQFEDFFKIYGMLAGLCGSALLERKAAVDRSFPLWRRLLHTLVSVLVALLVKSLLELDTDSVRIMFAFESVKHFILTFLSLGICPLVLYNVDNRFKK